MKHLRTYLVITASSPDLPRNVRKCIPSKTIITHTQGEKELRLAHANIPNEARRAQRAVEEERGRFTRGLHNTF